MKTESLKNTKFVFKNIENVQETVRNTLERC